MKPCYKPVALTLAGLVAFCLIYPYIQRSPVPVASARKLPHHVYVWQRDWNSAVTNSFGKHRKEFSSAILLGAEIAFDAKKTETVAWAEVDWTSIRATQQPVGIALRIQPFRGPFRTNSSQFKVIETTAKKLIKTAAEKQVVINELHIDFDCAESNLAGYAIWLRGLQSEFPNQDISITALPAWLNNRKGFRELIAPLPYYVLQVHSLEHPRKNRTPYLCDPNQAGEWIGKAARFGKPFLVALPTYSYLVAEDDTGRFIGIKAEGDWNAREHHGEALKIRKLSSSPIQMAKLVQKWNDTSPAALHGIIWYRLPVAGDQLNWHWATLESVMAGKVPKAEIISTVTNPKPGLYEIFVENRGTDEYPGAVRVHVAWSKNSLVAGDALSHFELNRGNGDSAVFAAPTNTIFIPQSSTKIGWLRFSHTNEVPLETTLSIP